jgi:flagellar biosynthesis protein FlhF
MKIKSYFTHSVEDAMAKAALELGPDAMLLNSRKAPPESGHPGEYEVVFATAAPVSKSGDGLAETAAAYVEAASPVDERLSRELADLKKEMEGMRRTLTRSVIAPSQLAGAPPDMADAYAALTGSEVPADLAREIVQRAEGRLSGPRGRASQRRDQTAFQRALIEELESRFQVQPALGRGDARPAIVALVGPPGAGKTTTLVKLAVNYGLAARKPVLLLSADNYRVAASEQLRCFAGILGVGFQILETVSAVAQAIEEHRGKELILLDTPGFCFQDMDGASAMAQFLSTRSDIDTHLVLSSSMKSADLSRVADSFEIFRPQRLLFTKLDETVSFGPIFAEAVRTGKPLSFFTNGQRIPEDLEAASRNRLLQLMLAGRCDEAASAA